MRQLLLVALLMQTPATETFRISGRILSLHTAALPASVMLRSMNERQGTGRTVPVNTDGTFEFSAVASGEYDLNVVDSHPYRRFEISNSGAPFVIESPVGPGRNFTFKNRNIVGFDIKMPVPAEGRVVMADGTRAEVPLMIEFISTLDNGGARSSPFRTEISFSNAGRFEIPVYVGEQQIKVSRVPDSYTVKSVTYLTVDLLKNPLRLTSVPDSEILITLERR